jgi:glycosyltransferase involved in cell wall biosynthesis
MRTLNFVSDIATPHVNALLAAVQRRGDVHLNLFYAVDAKPELYPWTRNLTHEVVPAFVYGQRRPNLAVIARMLARGAGRTVLVGWSNPTTGVLLPLLAAKGRFAFYCDRPIDERRGSGIRRGVRQSYFELLRRRAIVLAVGKTTVEYFLARGFDADMVENLPIPVVVPNNLDALRGRRDEFRQRYHVAADQVFVVTGSRLVESKGFDVLLRAVAELSPEERARLRVLIIGDGPERGALETLRTQFGVRGTVMFEKWLDFDEFTAIHAAADVVVHPARFDAYGAASLMAAGLGLPVLGSDAAGSAVELIEHGKSGLIHRAGDAHSLAGHFRQILARPEILAEMGSNLAARARDYTAERLADRLVRRLFEEEQ